MLRSAAAEKKAWDPVVLDVREQTSVADYFVICEGETDRQVRAIADGMVEAAKAKDRRPLAVDGYSDAGWILLDFDSVLAHVFLPGERSYYDLESPPLSATLSPGGRGWLRIRLVGRSGRRFLAVPRGVRLGAFSSRRTGSGCGGRPRVSRLSRASGAV
ncbi:MAG: ribosome silencing factor [Chloroflexi bacterium]|nr:MAG: ribosome silencing factor [Chloroflexota bacterium]